MHSAVYTVVVQRTIVHLRPPYQAEPTYVLLRTATALFRTPFSASVVVRLL